MCNNTRVKEGCDIETLVYKVQNQVHVGTLLTGLQSTEKSACMDQSCYHSKGHRHGTRSKHRVNIVVGVMLINCAKSK